MQYSNVNYWRTVEVNNVQLENKNGKRENLNKCGVLLEFIGLYGMMEKVIQKVCVCGSECRVR